jgi:phosphatidylglycerol---prolipoprotein diacylglyceryl transferase
MHLSKKTTLGLLLVLAGLIVVFLLAQVFKGDISVPQQIVIGPLRIQIYGLILAAAIFIGYLVALSRSVRFSITPQQTETILAHVIIGGFIGARLYHVFSDFPYYLEHPLRTFAVWQGGLSIYGALIGGAIVLLWQNKNGASFLRALDWLTPSVVVGQIIGRFGNFFNYELYGYPTNLPWKMFVPEAFRVPSVSGSSYFHPLFLYEAVLNTIILLILWRYERYIKSPGKLFLYYILLYNISRFCLEFLRIEAVFIGNLRQNALVSLVLAGFASSILIYLYVRKVPQN